MDYGFTGYDLVLGLPLLILLLGAIFIIVFEFFSFEPSRKKEAAGAISILSLFLSFMITLLRLFALYGLNDPDPTRKGFIVNLFNKSYFLDTPHLIGHIIVIGCALLSAFLSIPYLKHDDEDSPRVGEYFSLLLLMPLGGMMMISGMNLMVCFIGLEILSISLYVLAAIRPRREASVEAGLKYFLLGAFASAFFVFGLALIYAGGGTINVPLFRVQFNQPPAMEGIAALGGAFVFAALLFKASLFPFQMWTPDVYQGAPTPITALMSTGTKAAAFLLMAAVAGLVPGEVKYAVPTIAVLTMAVGNFGALRQNDLKRMLAYSGIAHAGYLLVGINSLMAGKSWPDSQFPARTIYFYLIAYGLANLGALGVIAFLEKGEEKCVTLEGFKGLSRRHPVAAALMTVFLVSLGGIPPTAGFIAKFVIFSQAIRQGFYVLAVLGLLLSAVSLYYYLRVVIYMYMLRPEKEEPVSMPSVLMGIPLGVSAVGVLLLGVVPSMVLDLLMNVNI